MSGRRLEITQRQIRAVCEAAKKEGYWPVIQVGNTLVRLIPEEHAIQNLGKSRLDNAGNSNGTTPSAYDKWKAGKDASSA